MSAEPTVSSRILHAFRDFASTKLGPARAEPLFEQTVRGADGDLDAAKDARGWVPMRVLQAVADAYERELGADFVVNAVTWVVPLRRDLSAMSLSSLVTPTAYYRALDRGRAYYTRHLSFRPTNHGGGRATVELHFAEGLERHTASCRVARGVLMAIPLLFELPMAEVEETQCWAQGADFCRFEVRFQEQLPWTAMGLGAGALAGAVGALLAPSFAWALSPLVLGMLGREVALSRRRALVARISEGHRRVLGENERDFKRRYDEIRALNEGLEQRVAERTQELETTLRELAARNAELRAMLEDMKRLHGEVVDAAEETLLDRSLQELEHEINNPMASVLANLEFLRIEPPTVTDLDGLEAVVKDIQSGMDRIRGVLSWFVRVHRTSDNAQRYDLGQELQDTVRHMARRYSGRIQLHLETEPLVVSGYGRQLTHVFLNVIKNAADAVGHGNVWLTAKRKGEHAVVTVRDDGPGMTAEQLERIFERGYTTKADRGGQGLGLHLCKIIVARHGGSISAVSEPGAGAIFQIELPLWGEPSLVPAVGATAVVPHSSMPPSSDH